MAVWVVRGGTDGEFEEQALKEGVVAVKFGEIPEDLITGLDGTQMKDQVAKRFEEFGPEARVPYEIIAQFCYFRDAIRLDELVVMPHKKRDGDWQEAAVGKIKGTYQDTGEFNGFRHSRAVEWINKAVPRNYVDQGTQQDMDPMNDGRCVVYIGDPGKDTDKSRQAEERFRVAAERGLWDDFVGRAREYVDSGALQSEEIDYKVETGRRLSEARDAVLVGSEGWDGLVKRGVGGNLIFSIEQARFRDWLDESPGDSLIALRSLWTREPSAAAERVRGFCRVMPRSASSGSGVRTTVASVLLMGVDVEQYPPFRVTYFSDAYQRTAFGPPEADADEAGLYEHALAFLDRFIEEASLRGLSLRHRLDAQSLVWAIRQSDQEEIVDPRPSAPTDNLDTLAEDLSLPLSFLEDICSLLKDKKQVIFQGPPGTGKTYVAQKLAECLAGSKERVTVVQFHPSYAYEDFVQGFRPASMSDGQPGFKLREGPLLLAGERARKEPDTDHFLVIDEINRGNLAKVFGELYFLLEYRGHEMDLQYSDEPFALPENLYIIGTMNTADRSIARVDLALRRRFYFVEFHPDVEPVKGLLQHWLRKNAPHMAWVADVVDRANENLNDRHAVIGPSHFMVDNLDEALVRLKWEHSILPHVEEHFFDEPPRLADFKLETLRGVATSSDSVEDEAQAGDDEMEDQVGSV